MNGLLDQLGKKVADSWLTTLLLPGMLWVCTAALAWQLGWAHALDPGAAEPLIRWLDGSRPAGQGIAVAVVALIVAAGAGLTAAGVAAVLRGVRPVAARGAVARWLRAIRRRRWDRAGRLAERLEADALGAAVGSVVAGPEIAEARARQHAIGLERPEHATWVGDRLRATALRIHRAYGLDVTVAWPRLWVVLPDSLRADVAQAQGSYAAAGVLVGWAVLYALLGLLWGPALLIASVVLVVGVLRARSATEVLCQLVEAAVDLYGAAFAEQLRIPCDGALTPAVGGAIDELLRKEPRRSAPPVADPVPDRLDEP
ncbi:hypothetical protein [Pseudonocardia acaciae]|uniref:hypothetical protein n=1 Tax=Pseudonocardia acaciae TaxID=551276 RepID=UPI00068709EC|nr:hypothetical protein [Pseudonocardia acaciae]